MTEPEHSYHCYTVADGRLYVVQQDTENRDTAPFVFRMFDLKTGRELAESRVLDGWKASWFTYFTIDATGKYLLCGDAPWKTKTITAYRKVRHSKWQKNDLKNPRRGFATYSAPTVSIICSAFLLSSKRTAMRLLTPGSCIVTP